VKTKICSRCKQKKGVKSFGKSASSKNGLNWYCRDCSRIVSREYRIKYKYPELFKKYNHSCSVCKGKEDLQVHHLKRKSDDRLESLVLVCKSCHKKVFHPNSWREKHNELRCVRCGHKWTPRKEDIRLCPKCKSPYWDRKRK